LSAFAAWDCPKAVHTDVVGAALAEQRWGAGRGEDALAYVTIGTGIGAGVLQGGRPVGGAWHLEFGHLRAQRLPGDDFPGVCPFHGDCFEGLASGPAIAARSGARLSDLPPDHPAHALEVGYLAQLCAALVFSHAPGRILLGGGVLQTPHLLERVRARLPDLLGGYAGYAQAQAPASFLQAPGLGGRAGALGAVALAMQAARL
jgi:fructokinase